MSTRRTSRVPRAFAVTAAAAAALTLSSASALASNPAASSGRVDSSADGRADRHDRRHHARETQIQLLSFNDLHGNLEPPAGSGGRITTGYTESTTTPPAPPPTPVEAGGPGRPPDHGGRGRHRVPGHPPEGGSPGTPQLRDGCRGRPHRRLAAAVGRL